MAHGAHQGGSADAHSPQVGLAGRDVLSLALIDARNRTLRWLAAFEAALGSPPWSFPAQEALDPPLWLVGHAGWFQERWIARNVQRRRGEAADPRAAGLASVLPDADRWYDPAQSSPAERWRLDLPAGAALRQYLSDTIELTLELLDAAEETDAGLHAFRLSLHHEDRQAEALAETAQGLGVPVGAADGLLREMVSLPPREPLWFPACRWTLGSPPGGFVDEAQKWAHEVAVPEFEIDAQPVTWGQYAEFVADGGYDDPRWWSPHGQAWLERETRRVPRYVDQLRGGVLQQRFGRLARVPSGQPAVHVSWHEAQAWCRWAGRRLPAEVEWEAAAHASSRGFAWGQVWEWTGGSFRAYPLSAAAPPLATLGKAQRGASFATAARLRSTKARRGRGVEDDRGFCGFRSCAV